MKYGIECEGRLRGVPTIFMSSDEFLKLKASGISELNLREKAAHIYVSFGDNSVSLDRVLMLADSLPDWLVTVDLTKLTKHCDNTTAHRKSAKNLVVMLRADNLEWWHLRYLMPNDMIKIEFPGRHVAVVEVKDFVLTQPKEFNRDVQL